MLRIALPLVVVAAVLGLLVALVRPHIRYEGYLPDVSAWGAFFTVFGVIYAIVAGFLLVTVLSCYSDLSQTIEDELNAVESIRDLLIYFGAEQKAFAGKITESLAAYVDALAKVEWKEMAAPVRNNGRRV